MKPVHNSEVSLLNINEVNDTNAERVFDYDINKKKTKAKLLKGATRKNLEVEVKSSCVNLRFNDGAYYEVIMPLLNEWNDRVNSVVKVKGHDVLIVGVEKGLEKTKRHVDTKLTIMFADCRYVLHAYNTTQNLMVQGKNSESFAINYLEPFFNEKIDSVIDKIHTFNQTAVKELAENSSSSNAGHTFNIQYQLHISLNFPI